VSSDPTIGATNTALENNPTAIADFFNEWLYCNSHT
jgi:hypothetical protein